MLKLKRTKRTVGDEFDEENIYEFLQPFRVVFMNLRNKFSSIAGFNFQDQTLTAPNIQITGNANFNGPISANDSLIIQNNTSIGGNLTLTSGNLEVFSGSTTLSGPTIVNDTLSVAGTGTITGNIIGSNTLQISGPTTLGSNAIIQGSTTLNSTLSVQGNTTLQGAATLNNNLSVQGTTTLNDTIVNSLEIDNNTTIKGTLTGENNNLNIQGNANISGLLSAINIESGVWIPTRGSSSDVGVDEWIGANSITYFRFGNIVQLDGIINFNVLERSGLVDNNRIRIHYFFGPANLVPLGFVPGRIPNGTAILGKIRGGQYITSGGYLNQMYIAPSPSSSQIEFVNGACDAGECFVRFSLSYPLIV